MLLIVMRMVITFIGRGLMCLEEGQDGIVRSREQTRNFIMMKKFRVGAYVWLAWFDSILYSISFLYLCYSKLHMVYLFMSAPLPDWEFEDRDAILLDFASPMPSTWPDLWNQKETSSKNFQRHWDFSWVTKDARNLPWWQSAYWLKDQTEQRWQVQGPTGSMRFASSGGR